MAKVQRFVQTALNSNPAPPFKVAAVAAPERIYLGIFAGGTAGNIVLSLKQVAASANGMLVAGSTIGSPYKEWIRADHGVLVQQEWLYVCTSPIAVLELYEEDTGYRKSQGGVYLGSDRPLLNDLTGAADDQAVILRQRIYDATRGLVNGRT